MIPAEDSPSGRGEARPDALESEQMPAEPGCVPGGRMWAQTSAVSPAARVEAMVRGCEGGASCAGKGLWRRTAQEGSSARGPHSRSSRLVSSSVDWPEREAERSFLGQGQNARR